MESLFSNKKISKSRQDIKGYCYTCDSVCQSNCYNVCSNSCTRFCTGQCNGTCDGVGKYSW